MSNNKQSSVEWLVGKFSRVLRDTHFSDEQNFNMIKYIEQAKAMHKVEIVNAVDGFPIHTRHMLGDDYYNEVYGCSDALNESRNFGNESEDVFKGD